MYARHTFLSITPAGRQGILADPALLAQHHDTLPMFYDLFAEQENNTFLPGIARREETSLRKGAIAAGFVHWKLHNGKRFRVGTFVPEPEIVTATTPFALLASAENNRRTPSLQVLAAIRKIATQLGVRIGAWGSAGLELFTRLPYTHERSDLDLLVAPAPHDILRTLYTELCAIELQSGVRLDAELALGSGYGVSIKELFAQGFSVLGKGLHTVDLLTKEAVFAELP